MSDRLWHYAIDNEKHGPVPEDELRQLARTGAISPDTLVWTEGLPDWKPAGQIQGLFPPSEAPVPPAVPPSVGLDPTHQPPVAPPTTPGAIPEQTGDATGGVIPYKNPAALIGYYLTIASLVPFLGIVTGIIACVLGVVGLRERRKKPQIRGAVHAWIGIIGGGGLALIWTVLIIVLVVYGA